MRKPVFGLAVSLMVLQVMSAFAGGNQASSSKKVELDMWSVTGGNRSEYWAARIREFEKLNPNIKINDEYQIQTDFEIKLPAAIAAGNAPAIWTQSYRSVVDNQKNLQPVTDEIAKFMGYADSKAVGNAWDLGALSQYMVDGKIYGFPYQVEYFCYAINKQHFIDAGLDPRRDYPKTWDDVITIGKKLTQWKDGRIIREAMTFPYSGPPIWYVMVIQPMLVERGIDFFNADGTECLFNRPEVAAAMNHFKRRFAEGVSDKGLSSTSEYMQTIGSGANSMAVISTNGTIASFEEQYPQTKGQLMLIPNPAYPGTTARHAASTWGYSVYANQNDTKKSWAWKLVDYITSDPRSSMEKINSLLPRAGWEKTEWATQIRDMEMVAEVSRTSFPSGTIRHWPELQFPVQRAIQRILFEDADIQTALNEATAEVNEKIRNKR